MGYTIESLYKICFSISKEHAADKKQFFYLLDILKHPFTKNEIESFFQIKKVKKILPVLRKKWSLFEESLELDFAEKFIYDNDIIISDFIFWKRYLQLTKNELQLSSIKKHQKVLVIGSGPLPLTAILYWQKTKCRIDCIDNKKNNVRISNKVIKKLMIGDKIKIRYYDGKKDFSKKYDIVFVAALALPKKLILENIYNSTKPNCKIIVRTVSGLNKILYEPIDDYIINFNILNRKGANSKKIFNSAYLLGKKN